MIPRLKELYIKKIRPNMKEKFGFKNFYMAPKLEKVSETDPLNPLNPYAL